MNIDVLRQAEVSYRQRDRSEDVGLQLADQTDHQQRKTIELHEGLQNILELSMPIRKAAGLLVEASGELDTVWTPRNKSMIPAINPSHSPLVKVGATGAGAKIYIGVREVEQGSQYGVDDYEFVPFLANPLRPSADRYPDERKPNARHFIGHNLAGTPLFGVQLTDAIEKTEEITEPLERHDHYLNMLDSDVSDAELVVVEAGSPVTIDAAVELSKERIRAIRETLAIMKDGAKDEIGEHFASMPRAQQVVSSALNQASNNLVHKQR